MRRTFSLFAVIALLCAGTSARADEGVYEDPVRGIRVEVPDGWAPVDRGLFVGFVSDGAEGRPFVSNVNVIVAPVRRAPEGEEEYRRTAENQIRRHLPDAEIAAFGPAVVGGLPGYQVLFTARQGPSKLLYYQAFTVSGGFSYFVTYTADLFAPRDVFERDLSGAVSMIRSLEIRPSAVPALSAH